MTEISYNEWAYELYRWPPRHDYLIAHGGRGSSKTYEVTQALVIHGHHRPLRIAVAREHLKSIDESAKPELEDRARRLGILRNDCYRAFKTSIDHANGTHFFFIGLSKVSEEDIKGLAQVDILWIEEAHKMSHSSWELIRPTIRKDGAVIIATYNRKFRSDAIDLFAARNSDNSLVWVRHVTWRDNAFFTDRNDRARLMDRETEPDRYGHIWDGLYDDHSEKRKVLPYAMLDKCVQAWKLRPKPRGAFASAGLDIADTGADSNAYAERSGPELYLMDKWKGSNRWTVDKTARHAAAMATESGVRTFHYDAGGPGAGVRGPLQEAKRPFAVRGCHFGGKVQAPDSTFVRGRKPITQAEYFANWASQAGWAVRLRAENTVRLLATGDVDPARCLFINPGIPNLPDKLRVLEQPEWDKSSGKLKIIKRPREPGQKKPPSPDDYDGVILAFSNDCRRGLKGHVATIADS